MLNIFNTLEKVEKQYTLDKTVSSHIRPAISHDFGKKLAEFLEFDMTNGPWLAGGMLRKLFNHEEPRHSDWDVWFKDFDQFKQACDKILDLEGSIEVYRSKNAATFNVNNNTRTYKVQLINKTFYNSPQDLINSFDFTVCQLVTDGNQMLVGSYTMQDLKTRTLRLADTNFLARKGILTRIVKYSVYGYKMHHTLSSMIENNPQIIQIQDDQNDYDIF